MIFKCPNCRNYLVGTRQLFHKGKDCILMHCYSCSTAYVRYIVNKLAIVEQLTEDDITGIYGFGGYGDYD